MIKIHRQRPVVRIGEQTVKLTRAEHELITVLGMLDNKLVSHQLLLDLLTEGQVQIPEDKEVLCARLARLKRKIGSNRVRCHRHHGYILIGDVQFYG